MSSSSATQRLGPLQAQGGASEPAARAAARPRAPIAPLQARGVGQLLDATAETFVAHFLPLMGLTLALAVPIELVYFSLSRSALGGPELPFPELAWGLLSVPAQVLANAFTFAFVGGALMGEPSAPLQAAGQAVRKLPALLFLVVVSTVLALMTCGVGGVVTTWLLGPAIGLVVLADVRLGDVLPRTFNLALGWGSFGRWMGLYIVTSVVLGGLGTAEAALDVPDVRSTVLVHTPLSALGLDLLLIAVSSVLLSLQMAVNAVSLVVFYLDLCVRRNGLDLRQGLARLRAARRRPALGGAVSS